MSGLNKEEEGCSAVPERVGVGSDYSQGELLRVGTSVQQEGERNRRLPHELGDTKLQQLKSYQARLQSEMKELKTELEELYKKAKDQDAGSVQPPPRPPQLVAVDMSAALSPTSPRDWDHGGHVEAKEKPEEIRSSSKARAPGGDEPRKTVLDGEMLLEKIEWLKKENRTGSATTLAVNPKIMQVAAAAVGSVAASLRLDTPPPQAAVAVGGITFVTDNIQARRLFVRNMPDGIMGRDLVGFLNQQMHLAGLTQTSRDPISSCRMKMNTLNQKYSYALLEFRSIDETTLAMSLDGIQFQGKSLELRRPHNYQPAPKTDPKAVPGGQGTRTRIVKTTVPEKRPHQLFIGGLPKCLDEEQVKERLTSFGKLSAFDLKKDFVTGRSKGYCFCAYEDLSITDQVIAGLNGKDWGGNGSLTVARYNQPTQK